MGWLKRTLLGLSPAEANPDRRGFETGVASVRERVGRIGGHFIEGYNAALLDGEPVRLAETLNQNVESEFRGFAFEGVGLAGLSAVKAACGHYLPMLRQGVAFAALSRAKAGNPAAWTAMACETLCEGSADDIVAMTLATGEGLAGQGESPAYEMWRQRLQSQFSPHEPSGL